MIYWGWLGQEGNREYPCPSLKLLCTHILRALRSSGPCVSQRLEKIWARFREERWRQGGRCLPAHLCIPEVSSSSGKEVCELLSRGYLAMCGTEPAAPLHPALAALK